MNTNQSNSKASHTPGPWIERWGDRVGYIFVNPKGRKRFVDIASVLLPREVGNHVKSYDNMKLEREANARLIAAAPEMLEALNAVANLLHNDDPTIEDQDRVLNQVVEVIIKAKGE